MATIGQEGINMEKIKKYYDQASSFAAFADSYFDHLYAMLKAIGKAELEKFLKTLLTARQRGATVYFLGNGGSATTAAHYVNDLGKFANRHKTKNFKVMCLSDNISWFSALANDEGYENVFVRQLENFIQPGDVVVGISASGNSVNILKALELANNSGAISVALVGFDGGKMKQVAQECVHAKSGQGEYGPVEDVHMILDHLLTCYIALLSEQDEVEYESAK
jgi:D-sedoheptulose 7-phosphate isomerase